MKPFLIVFAIAVCAAEGVSIYFNATRPVPVAAPTAPAALTGVEVAKVSKTPSYGGIELSGRLEAGSDVEIRSGLSGYVVRIATVRTVVNIGEWEYQKVAADQEARIVVDGDREYVGKIVGKDSAVNPMTHTASVFVEAPNPNGLLKPGTTARVRLMIDRPAGAGLAEVSSSRRTRSAPSQSHSSGEPIINPQAVTDLLTSLKGLAVTMSTAAKEVEQRETAARASAQATAEVSNRYFISLEKLVGELRFDPKSYHMADFERTAEKIDDMPILHVDDELLAFGADVSKSLREMAEQRRALGRLNATADWSVLDHLQRQANAVKTQGLKKIKNGLADLRRKLTKKYNLEFLATAGTTRPAAMRDHHSARR
jgi:hypothetical protein